MKSKEYIKGQLDYLKEYEPSLSFDIDMHKNILKDLEKLEALTVNVNVAQSLAKKYKEENDNLKKVIEILKRKTFIVKTPNGIEFRIYEKITQQDYMLLQEVIWNE